MPIPLPSDFASLNGQLQGFSGSINGLLKTVDGDARDVISSLLKVWEKNFGDLQTAYPATMNDMQSNISKLQGQHTSLKSSIANAKAEVAKVAQAQAAAAAAAAATKKAPPKVPPLKPIDPDLGVSLRDELLERFGVAADAPEHQPEEIHEIWEGWKFESWDKN